MSAKKGNQYKLNHKQFFGLLFFCLTLLIYGACYMLQNGGITYESVTGAFVEVLPSCFIIAMLGYLMGSILDNPAKAKIQDNKDMINKFIQDAAAQAAQSAQEIKMAADANSAASLSEDIGLKIDTETDI